MVRNYAVTFYDKDSKEVRVDTFTDNCAVEAKKSFEACYRHGNYTVLSVVEVPGSESNWEDEQDEWEG